MAKWYLVYKGYAKARDGRIYVRDRVVRLGSFKGRPRIVDKYRDPMTGRVVVMIERKIVIPKKTYTRRGRRVTRKRYVVTRRFHVGLGKVADMKSIRLTRHPPKDALLD